MRGRDGRERDAPPQQHTGRVVLVCARVCMCVCERERERDRGAAPRAAGRAGEGEGWREKEERGGREGELRR